MWNQQKELASRQEFYVITSVPCRCLEVEILVGLKLVITTYEKRRLIERRSPQLLQ